MKIQSPNQTRRILKNKIGQYHLLLKNKLEIKILLKLVKAQQLLHLLTILALVLVKVRKKVRRSRKKNGLLMLSKTTILKRLKCFRQKIQRDKIHFTQI